MRRPSPAPLPWLAGLLAAPLIAPFVAGIAQLGLADWRSVDWTGLGGACAVSLLSARLTSVVVSIGGILLGYLLARVSGRGMALLGFVVQLPLALPRWRTACSCCFSWAVQPTLPAERRRADGLLPALSWPRHDRPPQADPAGWIVQSWDIATMTGEANDFSVCTTWHMIKGDYYLIDVFRARLQYPDLKRKLASLGARHGAQTILIENAGPGMTLLQDLHHDTPPGMPHPIGQKPIGGKEADWLDSFLLELLAFPHGKHDDQVDSVSQFLIWAALREFVNNQPCVIPIIVQKEQPSWYWEDRRF